MEPPVTLRRSVRCSPISCVEPATPSTVALHAGLIPVASARFCAFSRRRPASTKPKVTGSNPVGPVHFLASDCRFMQSQSQIPRGACGRRSTPLQVDAERFREVLVSSWSHFLLGSPARSGTARQRSAHRRVPGVARNLAFADHEAPGRQGTSAAATGLGQARLRRVGESPLGIGHAGASGSSTGCAVRLAINTDETGCQRRRWSRGRRFYPPTRGTSVSDGRSQLEV